MGMLGLRDVFVVAPTAPFHQAAAAHHDQFLSAAEAHPIIPLLAAAPYLPDDPRPSKIQLSWQPQPPPLPQNPNPNSTTAPSSSGIHSSTAGASTCQDCGNQAKKDCTHRRCRTCCKSRGFDCSTHVKSTWIPASRRRERHLAISAAAAAGSSASTSASKKPRIFTSQTATNSHTSNSNTPSRSFDTSSSHQDASFRENPPGHVRAPAVFRCVRVASIDGDGEDEYAYHTKVTIGGHVFKGFLYDQGVDDGSFDHTGATSTAADANANAHNNISAAVPKISELNIRAGNSGAGVRRGGSSFAAPPSHNFREAAGVARMLGGSAFGNAIN